MAKILLVEDNEMNRDLITRRLKRGGYEVVMAGDGAEGVERANSEKPDLIVMDMGLPVLDGYEATRLLKNNDDTRHIPVIGLSAHAMSGDADKARGAGCDDYDTKPVEWSRLMPKIETLLAKAQEAKARLTTGEMPTTLLSSSSASHGGRVHHVLVADDSSLSRDVLVRRLGEMGYTCATTESGAETLEALAQKTFDALLLDVRLGDMTGAEVLQMLRAQPKTQNLPVLMVCPVDASDEAIACFEHGASDFVPQPFQAKVLSSRLEKALGQRFDQAREQTLGGEARHSEHLLRVLLPAEVVEELRETQKVLPRRHPDVAVLFGDVVGFKRFCDENDPLSALAQLQELIVAYEEIAARHRVLQVKTMGDAVMLAGGLFKTQAHAVLDCVRCALEMKEAANRLRPEWTVRFGIHAGPVVAGVVGRRKYQFDLWGTTVHTASRVKTLGHAGAVNLSAAAWNRTDGACVGEALAPVTLRDGGQLEIYRVDSVK